MNSKTTKYKIIRLASEEEYKEYGMYYEEDEVKPLLISINHHDISYNLVYKIDMNFQFTCSCGKLIRLKAKKLSKILKYVDNKELYIKHYSKKVSKDYAIQCMKSTFETNYDVYRITSAVLYKSCGIKFCTLCGNYNKQMKCCDKCKLVHYCNSNCETNDHERHKLEC